MAVFQVIDNNTHTTFSLAYIRTTELILTLSRWRAVQIAVQAHHLPLKGKVCKTNCADTKALPTGVTVANEIYEFEWP